LLSLGETGCGDLAAALLASIVDLAQALIEAFVIKFVIGCCRYLSSAVPAQGASYWLGAMLLHYNTNGPECCPVLRFIMIFDM
jgi:hypothetical protein